MKCRYGEAAGEGNVVELSEQFDCGYRIIKTMYVEK